MKTAQADWIWMNGRWVAWDDANIHVLSHVIHYGTSVFEGIRCYDRPDGPAIFRLDDHLRRLYHSARIYRMEVEYEYDVLYAAHREVVTKNKLSSCYIRPIIYRGFENLGINPFGKPVDVAVAAFPWGAYLGTEAIEKGVEACISSWRRPMPSTVPAWSKAGGHYMNSQLMKMEAVVNGYAEAISLDHDGNIAEGSGQNVFVVKDGVLYTPPAQASILLGITRDSVFRIASDLEIPVREEVFPRELLYTGDEAFFSGTAVEISPVISVDRIPVGDGKPGPITRRIQEEFFGILKGENPDRYGWMTPADGAVARSKGSKTASAPASGS